jgi:glycosyltransferase involved in cell wall biosynthesis
VTDPLLPTGRALLRRGDLGPGPWDDDGARALALAPLLGWLLDVAAPARAAAPAGSVLAALLGRLAEDRTTVVALDVATTVADLVVLDLAEEDDGDAAARAGAVLAAVAAGRVTTAVLLEGSTATRLDAVGPAVVHLRLAHAGGVVLLGSAGAGPVAEVAGRDAAEVDAWRRLQARLAAALLAERAAELAAGERDELVAGRGAARRALGRAEEEADRAREEAARLRIRLAAVEGLRGELVHAYDRLDRVLASASWRVTAPLRTVLRALPPVRALLRAVARTGVRILTPRGWREARSRRDRYGHADTAVALAEAATERSTGALRREKDPGHVGWVASVGDPFTTRYRVSNLSAALRAHGLRSTVLPSDGLDASLLESCATVVLCRVAWDDAIAAEVARLRESGTRIVFDVDDLVFDPSRVGLTSPGPNQVAPRRHLFGRYRTTLLEADAVTVSTSPLRDEVAALGRPVAVVPNNLGLDVLERWTDPTVARARRDARDGDPGTVRIAYLSGTATHVQDVREMAGAVAGVLRSNPAVELHVVGPVELPPELAGLRVVRHPLQRYHDLFALLATMDVNLAPLELENDFTDGKSELKVFEAALLGVPTIASPTRPYAAAIDHGRTGMLAATGGEWRAALDAIVGDSDLREALGAAARTDVAPRFAVHRVAGVAARLLSSLERSGDLAAIRTDLGAVRGDLALVLPSGEDEGRLRDLVVGLALDPAAGRCHLLLPEGDPNLPVVRRALAGLSHGAATGAVPRLVPLPVPAAAPPAAVAAAVLGATDATAVTVLPIGAAVATGSVAAALMALSDFHPPVVVGTAVVDGGVAASLRRLGLDADLAARPAVTVLDGSGAAGSRLGDAAPFMPVLDRDWAAARPAVLAALLAGDDVVGVLDRVLAADTPVTLVPTLRGSVRRPGVP